MKVTIKDWINTNEVYLCVGTNGNLVALFSEEHIVDDDRDIYCEDDACEIYPSKMKVELEGWYLCLTKKEFSKIFKVIGVK